MYCFQYKEEPEQFCERLKHRMMHFGLELDESKNKLIEFGKCAKERYRKTGNKPETFTFLGFTHYCSKSRNGKFKKEEEIQSSQESEVVVQDYPKPEYVFTTDEVTIAINGLSRECTIAWVSDLHLVSDHKAGEVLGDVHAEYLDAIDRRYEGLAVTSDGVYAEDLWPEIIKYLNYNNFDGVILGGYDGLLQQF